MKSMKRNLLFLGALFVAVLVSMGIQKPLFLLYYSDLAAGTGWTDWVRVVLNGLKLDLTVAGYVTAFPLLAVLGSIWVPGRLWRTAVRWWLRGVALAAAAIFAVDLGLYEFWGYRLDSSVLIYLATPREALASVTGWQIFRQSLIFIGYFGAMVWVFECVSRLFDPERPVRRCGATALFLVAAGVLFLAIRGGVSVATANVSKVYFSSNMFLNHAAVDPVFSFLSSLAGEEDSMFEYEFFDETRRAALFEPIRGDRSAGVRRDTLLRRERPDVIVILLESFGRSTVDETVDGAAVAPHFQRLKSEGVYFDNLFANSFRTDRGMVAVLSGFPAQTKMSIMKHPTKSQSLPSLARSLKRSGYTTGFMYGGDLKFTNTVSYLYATGFDELIWQRDMHFDAPTSKWGYADDVVFDAFADYVESCGRRTPPPFLAGLLTLSSHEPFDVPFERFEDRMLNAMAFTDACLGRFIERLKRSPLWDDLLVVLVADHAYGYPYGIGNSEVLRHRIPMLWLGGALRGPAVVDTYGSQSDICATLLAQLGLGHDDFCYSRDLFDPEAEHFGYYCFNNGFGYVDASGATIYDCTAGRVVSPDSSALQLDRGKALLQTLYKDIRER